MSARCLITRSFSTYCVPDAVPGPRATGEGHDACVCLRVDSPLMGWMGGEVATDSRGRVEERQHQARL